MRTRKVALRLGVSMGTLARWRRTGVGPQPIVIRGILIYVREEVEAFRIAREKKGPSADGR
jgi:predicted site-specific integrase-resolvase